MAAAGAWTPYNTAMLKIAQGIIDLDSHTFKIALFLSTSNCETLTHDELADLTHQVANGNGYTTGGQTVGSITLTNSSGVIKWDGNNAVWNATGSGITARFAVIYDDTVSGDPLVAYCLLDSTPADVSAVGGTDLTIAYDVNGILNISRA